MAEQNLYELLGLTKAATKDEIKRAYYRKIRIHTNEKHPEEFQRLTRAYQTLYDEQKRAEYDRYNQDDGVYAILSNQVMLQLDNGNFNAALSILEKMLVKYPNDPDVRYMIAECYIEIGRSDDAKTFATDLVFEDPQSEKYRSLLYIIYIQLEDLHRARKQINKLIEINPLERNYYIQLSAINIKQQRYDESVRILEQGLQATPTDLEDYPLLSELYFISYLKGDERLRGNVLQRIKSLAYSMDKQQLLYLLIQDCDETEQQHPGLPDLIRLVQEINNSEYHDVTNWLRNKRHFLKNYSQAEQIHREPELTLVDGHDRDDVRGSLFSSIVIGIILSMIATPIVGIIGGIIYYYYGKRILEFIGCLILIIIAIAVFAMLFI